MIIELSEKQVEFINEATHRWNGKIGATQCGKTHVDVTFVIPERLLERQGKSGLNVILGVTRETIERNVLEPMRAYWGEKRVGTISSRNIAVLFGQRVYCLGAEKVSQVTKLRGAKFKYAYCDEIVEYNKEVFELLKSRMSLDYSVCDFTGNPSYPTHYIKEFIDSNADVYCQGWTIFDNPFLSPTVVSEMCKEYEGSVYYDRYILGRWIRAEGCIYRAFADDPESHMATEAEMQDRLKKHPFTNIFVGVDFGHSISANTAVAVGITDDHRVYVLDEVYTKDIENPEQLYETHKRFLEGITARYGPCVVYCDNAEGMLIAGLRNVVTRAGIRASVRACRKHEIRDRIVLTSSLFSQGRLKILPTCRMLIDAFKTAVWDSKHDDVRLDDGTSNIDSLDAFEYSISAVMKRLETGGRIC